jgi:putative membrane protein
LAKYAYHVQSGESIGCVGLLLRWFVAAIVISLVAWLLPGMEISGFGRAMIVAVVLAVLNIFVKPFMVLLTLPLTLLTLGLFLIVINAILLYFAAWLLEGFAIRNFWWALLAAAIIAAANTLWQVFMEGLAAGRARG